MSKKDAEIQRLRGDVERLEQLIAGKFDRESVLKYLHYQEGGPITVSMTAPDFVRAFFAQLFIIAFDDADNFQTGSFHWKMDHYELTIRKLSGKSPAEILAELRAEVATLRSALERTVTHLQASIAGRAHANVDEAIAEASTALSKTENTSSCADTSPDPKPL